MIFKFSFGNTAGEPVEDPQEASAIIAAYGNCYDSPLVDVLPLHDIPVECEDERVHDGVNPCGDPTCYCAIYGYGVPGLSSPYPGQCDDCPGRSHPRCCWNLD